MGKFLTVMTVAGLLWGMMMPAYAEWHGEQHGGGRHHHGGWAGPAILGLGALGLGGAYFYNSPPYYVPPPVYYPPPPTYYIPPPVYYPPASPYYAPVPPNYYGR